MYVMINFYDGREILLALIFHQIALALFVKNRNATPHFALCLYLFFSLVFYSNSVVRIHMEGPTRSIYLCADLHNSLVRRLPYPIIQPRRDLVTTLQDQHPGLYLDLLGTQLLNFLSLIDNYDIPDSPFPYLTPQVLKPRTSATFCSTPTLTAETQAE